MQLLPFTAGGLAYAIAATQVVEVLPFIPARPVPTLPGYVLGMMTYRGRMIAVVDLPRRLTGEAAKPLLSTRLIVVEYAAPGNAGTPRGTVCRLGLVAENMVSTFRSEDAETVFGTMHLDSAPYLGRILRLNGTTVHTLVVENLLPAELASGLVPSQTAEPSP